MQAVCGDEAIGKSCMVIKMIGSIPPVVYDQTIGMYINKFSQKKKNFSFRGLHTQIIEDSYTKAFKMDGHYQFLTMLDTGTPKQH